MASQLTSLLTLCLVVGSIASGYAQADYPSEKCAVAQKVKAVVQYDVDVTPGTAKPRRLLIGRDFYDKAGHNTRTRQYEVRDSTQYSDRAYTYNAQGKQLTTASLAARKDESLVDSVGFDANGFLSYRKLYRPSGTVLVEVWMTTEVNDRKQPIKSMAFDKKKQLLGYTTFTYNADHKLLAEKTFSPTNEVQQQLVSTYHPNGTVWKTSELKGARDTVETKIFTPEGLLVVEISHSQQRANVIDNKTVRKYDSQQREVEQITYSDNLLPGDENKLTPSRREVSQYATSCLKTKTLIYTTAPFSTEEKLGVVFVYRYEFYQ